MMSLGKRNFRRYLAWSIILGLLVLFGVVLSRRLEFEKLVILIRYVENWKSIEQLALTLRDKPNGIDAAVADISVWGGRTKWVSSWMLMTSSLGTNVDRKLEAVVFSPEQPITRRIEAVRVLWIRNGNPSYLMQLFELTRSPGGPAVRVGRRYLRDCFEADDIRATFDVDESKPLPHTKAELEKLIRKPGALNVPDPTKIPLYGKS